MQSASTCGAWSTAAIERGELPPDTDVELIAESLPAFLWHHAVYNLEITADLLDRVLDLALR